MQNRQVHEKVEKVEKKRFLGSSSAAFWNNPLFPLPLAGFHPTPFSRDPPETQSFTPESRRKRKGLSRRKTEKDAFQVFLLRLLCRRRAASASTHLLSNGESSTLQLESLLFFRIEILNNTISGLHFYAGQFEKANFFRWRQDWRRKRFCKGTNFFYTPPGVWH